MVKDIQDFMRQAKDVFATLRLYNMQPSSWLVPIPIAAELKMVLSFGSETIPANLGGRVDLNVRGELFGFPFQGIDFLGYPMVIINMRAITFDEVFALFIRFDGAVTQDQYGIGRNKSGSQYCIEG